MELNTTASVTNSISKTENYPLYKDYNALLQKGYELVARYSGALWTNYNDSDPGITILQNLCYTLTELGNKADLPIADMLANVNGAITYEEHFHTPQQILPVNPVTLTDFSKTLLNAVPQLKQAYLTSSRILSGPAITTTYLEVKPEYAEQVRNDEAFIPFLQQRVGLLFHQQGNIAQLFTMPHVLSPTLLTLKGSITISKREPVEKVLANIIYAGNNFLSPYPVYERYEQLVTQGKSLFDLLEGPYLSGGYIHDSDIVSKRKQLTGNALSAVFQAVPGVEGVEINNMSTDKRNADSLLVNFFFDEAPFLSVESFSAVQVLVHGKTLTDFNPDKVSYYLNQLIPVQQPGSLDGLLPRGEYRNTGYYYSMQNNFPAVYHLTGKGPVDDVHQGKIKQLKAYLVLMEQLMGNYLAQLNDISSLFSFESGRTDTRLTASTYFTQPLYDVPGIDKILKGVNGSHSLQGEALNSSDWAAYKKDVKNPYSQQLNTTATTVANDLSRKLRALEHLLARCGKEYDHQPLQFTNPRYGPDPIAEVEYLKQTLQKFPLLSANRSRTYFKVSEESLLVSGLELNLENELGLREYYTGMVEAVKQSLDHEEGLEIIFYDNVHTAHVVYPASTSSPFHGVKNKRNQVEVLWNDMSLFSFSEVQALLPMNGVQAGEYLKPCLDVLKILATPFYGCVLLDCNRLMEFLRFRWTLNDDNGILYTSSTVSFDRLSRAMVYINSTETLAIKDIRQGSEFEIGVTSNLSWYSICSGITSKADADTIRNQLSLLRSSVSSKAIVIEVVEEGATAGISLNKLSGRVVAFFPDWVLLFQQESYRDLINGKLLALGPASAVCQYQLLSVSEFEELLRDYGLWMQGIDALYAGGKATPAARKAALGLLKRVARL